MKTKPWVKANNNASRDAACRVSEPDRPTEFEVQAFLWNGLRELGINARGEVKTTFSGRSCVRFDIAIFEGGELTGVLEIKSSPVNHKTTWGDTRQGDRYSQFGVPVRLICGMDQARQCLVDAASGNLWGK